MALSPCRECGQPVSSEAPACPHCGVPEPSQARHEQALRSEAAAKKKNEAAPLGCAAVVGLSMLLVAMCVAVLSDSSPPTGSQTSDGIPQLTQGPTAAVSGRANTEATQAVARRLQSDAIRSGYLRSIANPFGEGDVVFVPERRLGGVDRAHLWVVIDGQAAALNGPSKTVTPSLPWPRELPETWQSRSGLNIGMPAPAMIERIWPDE